MAIMFVRAQIISRGAGRSIVSAAAYRHRTRMMDEQAGTGFRYDGAASELVHEELALPPDTPVWLRAAIDGRTVAGASEALWNAVDVFEKRADAQLAREMIFALPQELSRCENIALVREFIVRNLTAHGMIADWVYHDVGNNPHIHVMTTLRPLTKDGFGRKKVAVAGKDGQPLRVVTPDRPNGKIIYRQWAGDAQILKEWKLAWSETTNRHLALAGHDVRIDGRSYTEQGLEGLATRHLGPARAALVRDGRNAFQPPAELAHRSAVADRLSDNPELLLKQISYERSTFGESDIARALHRHVDDPGVFANIHARIMISQELVTLREAHRQPETGRVIEPAVFTTRKLLRTEVAMGRSALALAKRPGFGVSARAVSRAIAYVENRVPERRFHFDAEQADAVRHITGDVAIAAIVGLAGAGKSSLLEAANVAWTAKGRRVIGAALAGKAAESLETSSGILARTLASWELSWMNGRESLGKGDILVIDEAGMIASDQMGRVLKIVEDAGAKVVLVGDPMQLQPIQAGAPFRAIIERIGFAELIGVRRQSQLWARHASRLFALGKVEDALARYSEHGHIIQTDTRVAAVERIVSDWSIASKAVVEDRMGLSDEFLVLAHTNADVKALNEAIRRVRKARDELHQSQTFLTERGGREFAIGDRIIFLENARFVEARAQHMGAQNVRNGMLGTIISTKDEKGQTLLTVRLDGGRDVTFSAGSYRNVDHGYAVTIHKSQGSTVRRTFVLATAGMDRHLTYVAMSRHRDRADLYAASEDFQPRPFRKRRVDYAAGITGVLAVNGLMRYRNDPDVDPTPYVDLKTMTGAVHRLWGVNLPAALAKGNIETGDTITLARDGTETVVKSVPVFDKATGVRRFEDREVERNIWSAVLIKKHQHGLISGRDDKYPAAKLPAVFAELVARLGRSGEKTTTLDFDSEAGFLAFIRQFAERRGIARALDIVPAIEDALARQVAWIVGERGHLSQLWGRAARALGLSRENAEQVEASSVQQAKLRAHAETKETFMLPAVAMFSTQAEEEAIRRVAASQQYRTDRDALAAAASYIWRDAPAAVAGIEEKAFSGTDPSRLATLVAGNPTAFGVLRGSGRLVDRITAAGRERKEALAAAREAARASRALAQSWNRICAREIELIKNERARMAVAVPALSFKAEIALARLTETLDKEPKAFEAQVLSVSPSVRAEFARINTALDSRFGRGAIEYNEKRVINMVPAEQRAGFKAMRERLRTVQKAVAVDTAHRINSERRTRAIGRSRGIEP